MNVDVVDVDSMDNMDMDGMVWFVCVESLGG